MNRVIEIGYLANDPELQYVGGNQTAKCSFRLGVTRRFSNQQGVREADFFPVVVWKKSAENAARYLKKGSRVAVMGSLQTRSWDAQDGTKRYITEIVAEEIEFLGNAKGESAASQAGGDALSQAQAAFGTGFVQVTDDELPF